MSSEFLKVASRAAEDAGAVLLEWFQGPPVSSTDKGSSIVTEVDLAADRVIADHLRRAFPEHRIFSEESDDKDYDSEFVWVVDPLDGTTNFVHRVARFCTSIGLLQNGKPILGVGYEPMLQEFFAAEVGSGATRNGERIVPSNRDDISRAVVHIGRGSGSEAAERFGELLPPINRTVRTLRATGATALALCYTACGRFDAHIGSHTFLYDGVAGAIIAREAGAAVSNFSGDEWNPPVGGHADLLISSPRLHGQFLDLLNGV
ncbi:MAG: inositol monophosphatase family protein [Verrucomicrobia bacterium]|nr:inositol monophosphatase family protein [Verrucomicrobiota bacterium]MDA1086511.1 inositol monophosphatase family protein [Verrucomicrobiota bacterium]